MKLPKSILVVITRRLGDVLLTTPLLRTLRQSYPDAILDVLVFKGTGGMLEGNPDIRTVLEVSPKLTVAASFKFLGSLWNRYDLAVSAMTGDKPTLYAFVAGRFRIGPVASETQWKSLFLNIFTSFDNLETHTVCQNLKLALAAGLKPIAEVVPPSCKVFAENFDAKRQILGLKNRYVIFHPFPKFEYKKWRTSYWIDLGQQLSADGFQVVISGGSDPGELKECAVISEKILGSLNLAGKLRLSQLAVVLEHAKCYVGTDTSVTHLAAATGIPVVAIYGPTNPVKWGPWPKGSQYGNNPWSRVGSQRSGNVRLVQGPGDCVPCGLEGCDRHIKSASRCLQELKVDDVYQAIHGFIEVSKNSNLLFN